MSMKMRSHAGEEYKTQYTQYLHSLMPISDPCNNICWRAVAALRGVTAPINVLQFSEATRMRAGLGAAPGKRMMPPFLVVAANEFRRARLCI